jgi:type II secretion system protein G
MLSKFASRRGFTLIELLIVIVVIAILALIVIPRVINASDRAREAARDANLHMINNALEQFRTDIGVYPSELVDLSAAAEGSVAAATKAYTGYVAAGFHGPYLNVKTGDVGDTGIPANPYKATTDTTLANHWTYTPSAGSDYTLAAP